MTPTVCARFEREARTLASLNHPNIASVHGLERANGFWRWSWSSSRGRRWPTGSPRPIGLDDALPIAAQMAEALEAAHEQGIVHRDLKPANVKVRPGWHVKVLDFGLAKPVEPHGPAARAWHSADDHLTGHDRAGVLLGTAAYMSPEQARGRAVDKRTDIWAFGVVLYEMLTGQRAFPGDDVPEVLASVLAREPDWTRLPVSLPQSVTMVIRRCLQRDRKQRMRDIGDASLALAGAFSADVVPLAPPRADSRPAWRPRVARRRGGRTGRTRHRPRGVARVARQRDTLTDAVRLRAATRADFAMTQRPVVATIPDGRGFLYQARDGLDLRSIGELEARLIPGATDAIDPFVSPDGQWVGYFSARGVLDQRTVDGASGQLRKISISGGSPVVLCAVSIPLGASWAADDTILFGQHTGIMRVSANGGVPELIVPAGENEEMYGPQLMPGGRAVLFSVTTAAIRAGLTTRPNRWDDAQVVVQPLPSGPRTVVASGGMDPRYLSSGHVVYTVRDTLFGVPFDADRLVATGGARPLVQGVQQPVGVLAAASNYDISDDGTLVFISGAAPKRSLVWRRRDATTDEPIAAIPPDAYEDPRLSPDASRVLVTRAGDIWIYDIASGRSSRVTRDGVSLMGVWDPAGAQIAYSSSAGGNLEAWVAAADGSAQPRQLTRLGGQIHVDSWSPDGRSLTVHRHATDGPVGILIVPIEHADREPDVFVEGKPSAEGADFSTDMRYVSYLSIETGRREIYVRPYPGPGGQVTVSVGGGQEPVWSPNGEVFYRSLNGDRMFGVATATAPTLKVGAPAMLFEGPYYISPTGSPRPQYTCHAGRTALPDARDRPGRRCVRHPPSHRRRAELVRRAEAIAAGQLIRTSFPMEQAMAEIGVARAVVVDNTDAQGAGRVGVRFPWHSRPDAIHWAPIAAPMAGRDRGLWFRPEPGDEVLVAFERGDLRHPYVVGGVWSRSDSATGGNRRRRP